MLPALSEERNKMLLERISIMQKALDEIADGEWASSGDILGATVNEVKAMRIAYNALNVQLEPVKQFAQESREINTNELEKDKTIDILLRQLSNALVSKVLLVKALNNIRKLSVANHYNCIKIHEITIKALDEVAKDNALNIRRD